jgi:ABC-2 type transport system permease protein
VAALHKDRGWRLFARTVVGRAYPRIIGAQRQWSGMVFDVVLPLIALSAYVFIYRAIGAPAAFVGFVIIGGAMSAFWLNVLWAMSNQFFWERETGNLALYIAAPTSLMAILLGMACGGMFYASLRALAIVAIGSWLFGVQYAVADPFMLAGVFVLTLVALYGMGMLFASVFLLFGREAWHLVSLSQEPVYLLSGMYFPVRSLNFWVAATASLIPLTLGLDAIRQLAFSTDPAVGFLEPRVEAAALAVLTLIFVVSARAALRYMERLAIAEGRLTESRG